MKRIVSLLFLFYTFNNLFGQTSTMKPLSELLNNNDSAWPMIQSWLDNATNHIEVLETTKEAGDLALYETQVTTRSTMGAIIHETGGILVDNGWIRIIGSGSSRLKRTLMKWNKGKSFHEADHQPSFLLFADDVLGGFYAINAGGIDSVNIGKVYYYSPDNLSWENTDLGYSDFIYFCCYGNIQLFYEGLRWDNWSIEVKNLNSDKAFSFYPFLWTKEGKDINVVSREVVPIQELWDLSFKSK